MQIKLFNDFPDKRPKPTANMEYGNIFQHKVAESIPNLIGEEMRGMLCLEDIVINFSNDIVCSDRIIECKSVMDERPVEEWYFNSSILQCAVYSSLLSKTDGNLATSTFFVNLGNPSITYTVKKDIDYYLRFGDDTYEILVNDSDGIVGFITDKARAACHWNTAREFDEQFKKKEYEILKDKFQFIKV